MKKTKFFIVVLLGIPFLSSGRIRFKSREDFHQVATVISYGQDEEKILGMGFFTEEMKDGQPFFVTNTDTVFRIYEAENHKWPDNITLVATDLKHNLALLQGNLLPGTPPLPLMPSLSRFNDTAEERRDVDIRFTMYSSRNKSQEQNATALTLKDGILKRAEGFILPHSLNSGILLHVLFNSQYRFDTVFSPVWLEFPEQNEDRFSYKTFIFSMMIEREHNLGTIVSTHILEKLIKSAQKARSYKEQRNVLLENLLRFLPNVFLSDGQTENEWKRQINYLSLIYREMKKLKREARGGDPIAQFRLAQIFREGYLLPKSDKKAVKWFSRSADHYPPAKHELATMIQSGNGVKKDLDLALKLFQEIAEVYPPAKHSAGIMILFRRAETKEEKQERDRRAFQLFQENASYAPSKHYSTTLLLDGRGGGTDNAAKGMKLLKELADAGYIPSQLLLERFRTEADRPEEVTCQIYFAESPP